MGSDIDTAICTRLQHEGIGSVYERIVLNRFFRRLAELHRYDSVMEYGCSITKGYDNIAFLDQHIPVMVVDQHVDQVQNSWIFAQKPLFSRPECAEPADLVWSFAEIQVNPELVERMRLFAKRHILVFVPNILNIGTPFHLAYHFFTRTACKHAERGQIRLRTKTGLLRMLNERGIAVVEAGYIDAPPIPDIGFSMRELKETLGWSGNGVAHGTTTDPTVLFKRVESMMRFEQSPVVARLKPFFGHHIYLLGRVI